MDVRILGPMEVLSGGRSIRLGGPRERKLLAVLLLNLNKTVPSSSLYRAMWDEPPLTARQQMYNAVASIRRLLLAGSVKVDISASQAGYRLVLPEHSLDLDRFQERVRQAKTAESAGDYDDAIRLLEEGLALWRGRLFEGLDCEYVVAAAHRFDEDRLAATEQLGWLRLRQGRPASLVSELIGLVAEHPLRESLRHLLIVALYRAGRQVEALAEYDRMRRFLATEVGLDPNPDLRKLHELMLNSEAVEIPPPAIDATAAKDCEAAPASSDPAAVELNGRCFLPYRTPDFAGRELEISKLIDDAKRSDVSALVISAIDGMGGVGKTALAVHVAHELAPYYPDGQYFIDLQGFSHDREPLTAEAALEILLLDSGMPAELIPADVTRRSAMWRAEMAGKRALILLDNALDASRVHPLVPGTPGNLVMVTSRRKLPGIDGAGQLSLDLLPLDDAVLLFRRVLGRDIAPDERAAVEEAVTLCGLLPLAIRIAAARLRDRKSWRISDLAEHLRDHRRRTRFLAVGGHSVQSALNLSYKCLQPAQRRTFRLLSLHPGPDVDRHVAAALTGVEANEATAILEKLFDDNLLLQPAPGRYQFHDLIRDCAVGLLETSEDAGSVEQARRSTRWPPTGTGMPGS